MSVPERMPRVRRRVVRVRKDSGKCGGRGACQSRYGAARLPSGASAGSTTPSDFRLPGKTRSRVLANVEAVHGASCDFNEHSLRVARAGAGQFLFLNFEHQFDGFAQIFETGSFGAALAIRARHFQTKGGEPFSIPLDKCGEVVRRWGGEWRASFHAATLRSPRPAGKPYGRSYLFEP